MTRVLTSVDLTAHALRASRAIGAAGAMDHADAQTSLSDVLADLMHWADEHHLSFDDAITGARRHYDAETSGIVLGGQG